MTKDGFDTAFGENSGVLWELAVRHIDPPKSEWMEWYGKHMAVHYAAFNATDTRTATVAAVASIAVVIGGGDGSGSVGGSRGDSGGSGGRSNSNKKKKGTKTPGKKKRQIKQKHQD